MQELSSIPVYFSIVLTSSEICNRSDYLYGMDVSVAWTLYGQVYCHLGCLFLESFWHLFLLSDLGFSARPILHILLYDKPHVQFLDSLFKSLHLPLCLFYSSAELYGFLCSCTPNPCITKTGHRVLWSALGNWPVAEPSEDSGGWRECHKDSRKLLSSHQTPGHLRDDS